MSKKIFVFAGKKARGKTTAAKYVRDTVGANGLLVDWYSFAAPLKAMAHSLGLSLDQCHGEDKNKNTPTMWNWEDLNPNLQKKFNKTNGSVSAREVLQIIGTDLFRNGFAEDVWVKIASFSAAKSIADVILFDDARFPNEIDEMKKNGAIIVHMLRNKGPSGDEHPSEKALDGYPKEHFHYTIGPDIEGAENIGKEVRKILLKEGLIMDDVGIMRERF
jgi:hypothetical protein